ncbi:MAG: lasso peptide biosynthesis B2 protein [Solirubrobacteraceae bacterium]
MTAPDLVAFSPGSIDSLHVSEVAPDVLHGRSLRQKLRLAVEILRAHGKVRARLRSDDLVEVLRVLRGERAAVQAPGPTATGYLEAALLARAMRRVLTIAPLDDSCLTESLVLTALLARRRIDTSLLIAARPGDEFAAHAWIEYAGRPLLPPATGAYRLLVEL